MAATGASAATPTIPYAGEVTDGVLPTLPSPANINSYYLDFDHAKEVAEPGYYSAADGIYAGDFESDGEDSFVVRRGNAFIISNVLEGGPGETTLRYGKATGDILTGDWDGDGTDTPGVNRIR